MAERDTDLDAVAKVLIPEAKSGDKYFTDKGRDCLTGFMHYLVSHVNDAKSDKGIPTQWRGMEASFPRSEEHTSELQSLMRISYAVFCLKKKKNETHYP